MHLLIDQLALLGRQPEDFLKLYDAAESTAWRDAPNINISRALAFMRNKQPREAREALATAMTKYTWIFTRLAQELNIEPIPSFIWGQQPNSKTAELISELYVRRMKDAWNTPEAISLFVEVAETIEPTSPKNLVKLAGKPSLNISRHVMLSEIPQLIGLLPREYTSQENSSLDPLPPEDSTRPPLEAEGPLGPGTPQLLENPPSGEGGIQPNVWLRNLFGWFQRNPDVREVALDAFDDPNMTTEQLRGVLRNMEDPTLQTPPGAFPSDGDEPSNRETPNNNQGQRGDLGVLQSLQEALQDDPSALEDLRHVAGEQFDVGRGGQQQAPQGLAAMLQGEQQQHGNAEPEAEAEAESPETAAEADQRSQRWLAGRGMLALREFTTAHGTNEAAWGADVDRAPLIDYGRRVRELRQRSTRNFILNHHLPQGTSMAVKELVVREVQRQGG